MVLKISSIKDYNEALSPFLEYHLTKYATEKIYLKVDIWRDYFYIHFYIGRASMDNVFYFQWNCPVKIQNQQKSSSAELKERRVSETSEF